MIMHVVSLKLQPYLSDDERRSRYSNVPDYDSGGNDNDFLRRASTSNLHFSENESIRGNNKRAVEINSENLQVNNETLFGIHEAIALFEADDDGAKGKEAGGLRESQQVQVIDSGSIERPVTRELFASGDNNEMVKELPEKK